MKKISFFLSFMLLTAALVAQELPLDPAIRHGKLDNGMTYYIQKNNLPENRAMFYLAQDVGSMQEEDNQSGLAHFLEHMAFKSTKNFPDKVIDYLEKGGMKMGQNINAYTSYDQTVYYLSDIPTDRPGLIDSCMLIIHDWCGFISLRDDDIDKERGVIKEEWRGRQGSWSRIFDKEVAAMYEGSKYANRNVIGDMKIIENFEYQTIKDYYHKWYRPDLQTVIIVGNVDVDEIEAKLKKLYQDIPKPVNPAERIYYPVKDNHDPIVTINSDPEAQYAQLKLYIKHDEYKGSKNTKERIIDVNTKNLFSSMLSARMQEIGQKPESPFVNLNMWYGNYYLALTKEAWSASAIAKEGKLEETLETIVREQERVKRHGFTDAEIERAKAQLLNHMENRYNNREKQFTANIASSILNKVQSKGFLPGVEYEYELLKKEIPLIKAEVFKKMANDFFINTNNVITVSGPEKEGLIYPTKDELLAVIASVQKENIEPYVETLTDEPLVSNLPPAGKVVDTKKGENYDETIWTLSNGMKVVIKETDFQADQILMSAISYGGTFGFDASEKPNYQDLSYLINFSGLGSFNAIDLKKKLAGKTASARPFINNSTIGLNGNSNKKELETMMQLTYLNLTSPHKDTKAFDAYIEEYKTVLLNRPKNPSAIFQDTINVTTYGGHPRSVYLGMDDLSKINYDRMLEMYKETFSNPGSMTFFFVGTIDKDVLKPLVETYLACLPSGNKDVKFKEDATYMVEKGEIKKHFKHQMEAPKVSVSIRYTTKKSAVDKNTTHEMAVLNAILQQAYFRAMRTEKSGVYGAYAYMNKERDTAMDNTTLSISFTTDPNRVDEMLEVAKGEMKSIADNGPRQDEYEKALESSINNRNSWAKMNGYWLAVLQAYHFYGDEEIIDFESRIRAVTPQHIQELVKGAFESGNEIEVVMLPAE